MACIGRPNLDGLQDIEFYEDSNRFEHDTRDREFPKSRTFGDACAQKRADIKFAGNMKREIRVTSVVETFRNFRHFKWYSSLVVRPKRLDAFSVDR